MVQNKIKSIYLKYLKGEQITISPEDHKLNSTLNYNFKNSDKSNYQAEYISYTHTLEASGLHVTEKLEKLTSLNSQDIDLWYAQFQKAASLCKWNKKARLEVLLALIDSSIPMNSMSSEQEIISSLYKIKFPVALEFNYFDKIKKIIKGILQQLMNTTRK